jgi:hypothetical protein
LIPAALSGEALDAKQKHVTDKCHDQIGPARHLDDSTMRSVVPIQTLHGVLLKRCLPPDENYSLFAINQQYGDAPARGAKMHQP